MSRSIGYIRVSTDKQEESPDAQRNQIIRYCIGNSRPDPEFVADLAVSGKVPISERPSGASLESLGSGDVVIVTKLDRLFRSTVDALDTMHRWSGRGVGVVILNAGGSVLDTQSALGKFFFTIMAAVAELERGLIGERTRETMANIKEQGRSRTGLRPYGYNLQADRFMVANEKEQLFLKDMREWALQGLEAKKIAERLNACGERMPSGSKFYAKTVQRILETDTERRNRNAKT